MNCFVNVKDILDISYAFAYVYKASHEEGMISQKSKIATVKC